MTTLASEYTAIPGIRAWIVPPLVVPIAFALMIAAVGLIRAFG